MEPHLLRRKCSQNGANMVDGTRLSAQVSYVSGLLTYVHIYTRTYRHTHKHTIVHTYIHTQYHNAVCYIVSPQRHCRWSSKPKMQFHTHRPPDKVQQQAFAKTAVCQQLLQDWATQNDVPSWLSIATCRTHDRR